MPAPSRRELLVSGAAATVFRPLRARAQTEGVTVLRLQRRTIEVNGKPAAVFGIRQPDGTFGLVTEVGRPFRVRVENQIDEPSLIHWHGLTPPWQQDGVPGISGPPIPPGGSADYDFPLTFGGTFWMHSHQGLQEQSLMLAPLIIHDGEGGSGRQEIVLMLNDFSFTPPKQIFEVLKKNASMPGMAGMAESSRAKPDLNDVKYDAFLANERTLADPVVVVVEPGAKVLLRVINGSSMSNYHVDLGRLDSRLVAVDGLPTAAVRGRRFPIAVGQRLDMNVTLPRGIAAYPVLAVLEGERRQTGIVLAAGSAPIERVPELADIASPPLTLALEWRLRAKQPLRPRKPDRVYTLNLTGAMAGYVWSINDIVWRPDVPSLQISQGERVQLNLVNRTPMPHPMHLHGHPFQVVEIDGSRFSGALRDTVLVPPGRRVAVAFDANNPGLWAFHCHLLYHLEAGMFTTFKYV